MILLGAQYYRPPFPNAKYWEDDLKRMADSGLNAIQLWVKWGWVEPEPGSFVYDDYDRLVEIAGENGLKVVLSTIAAIHPQWIHRVIPGSEMITNLGHKVVSSNRGECHFGLTPGGCIDHPDVWERMGGFLSETVTRYRAVPHLAGWDAWNELRWNVYADGLVCYCPHTLRRFRDWLDKKYGGLEGLNAAWQRRYTSWDDVRPGKMARSPYTEMMAFEHFITWRASEHGKARYDLMKGLDPDHPVTVHGGCPTVLQGGNGSTTSLDRGNDWFFADHLDGIGCSSFPHWQGMEDTDYFARIDCTASAARGKRIWLSEVQGGRAASGFMVHTPVPPDAQQRWIWGGVSRGAEAILFWCWRDEVFGRESAGFGLSGRDGFADARLSAMKETGRILHQNSDLLASYAPDPPAVGILFSPQSYYLHWNEEGHGWTAMDSIRGYVRALLRRNIAYSIVEEEHLDALDGLRMLLLPRTLVVDDATAEVLSVFVHNGGTLVCESECGAFGSNGLYRYPEDRFLAALTGICEIGRRTLHDTSIAATVGGRDLTLPARQWLTPFEPGAGRVLSKGEDGPLMVDATAGKGRVILCATYMGEAYFKGSTGKDDAYAPTCDSFESFLAALAQDADVFPDGLVLDPEAHDVPVHVRTGRCGNQPVAFVFSAPGKRCRLRFKPGLFTGELRDLVSGADIPLSDGKQGQECEVPRSDWGVALLVEHRDER